MNERDEALLRDMLNAAKRARSFVERRDRPALEANDALVGFAVARAIEIVGEAASKVSAETKETLPQIAWRQAIGMRHHIVHNYMNVDYDIVWDVATINLPELIQALEAILE